MKQKIVPVLCAAAALSITGCTGVTQSLQDVNQSLSSVNTALARGKGGGSSVAAFGPMHLSPEDRAALENVIRTAADREQRVNPALGAALRDATPLMVNTVDTVAANWMAAGNYQLVCQYLGRYGVPGDSGCFVGFHPFANTPLGTILKPVNIGNWKLGTRNAFSFSATFCADISGVCHALNFSVVDMGQGWQLRNVGL
ncbi:MAG: hypothetical protein LBH31_07295 [Burkholderiaceae bacterium]|nr:hypothetical protein [Burkholderiaceae bacterium]